MDAYNSIDDGNQANLHLAMKKCHKYLDFTCDIMEHKYLAFLFNTGALHWITMVVVNPSTNSMENQLHLDTEVKSLTGGSYFVVR